MRKITFFAKSPARPRKPKGIAAKIVTLMTLNTKHGAARPSRRGMVDFARLTTA